MATLALDADNAADAFKKFGLDIPGTLVNRTIRAFIDGFGGQSGFAGVGNFFGGLFGRESGGPLYSGQTALVGENGPELISPARSVRVTPIDRATMGPGLAPDITFNITPGNLTPTEVAHAIEMRLQRYTGGISASRRMNQRTQQNVGLR